MILNWNSQNNFLIEPNVKNKHSSDMKEQMLQILIEVSKGEKSPELAQTELLGLLSVIDSFDFDANALTFQEQMQLRMLLSTGKVVVKIGL